MTLTLVLELERRTRNKDWPYVFNVGTKIPAEPRNRLVNEAELFKQQLKDIREWCAEQFGPIDRVNRVTDRRWYYAGVSFYFRKEIDATAFKVRWG